MSEGTQESLEQLMRQRPESIAQLIESMSAEVYDALKLAVEIGKWADGQRLDAQQRDFCLQAVILYEAKHLPEQDRIGFDLAANCESKNGDTQTITVLTEKGRRE